MRFLISYDISSNKKRKKVSDLLSENGRRLQYSTFECIINKNELDDLIDKLNKEINSKKDSVLIIPLHKKNLENTLFLGIKYEERKVNLIIS